MKYFHISLGFEIEDRPMWLESFRAQYDKPYPYHVTLKNETSIEESEVSDLKSRLSALINEYQASELEMTFDQVEFNRTQKGFCIMVFAQEDRDVIDLRNDIFKQVEKFGDVVSDEHRRFDSDFRPHITIARHLNEGQLLQAKIDLPDKISFTIKPQKIVLSVVDKQDVKERLREENRNYFYFK